MTTLLAFIVLLWAWPKFIDTLDDGEDCEFTRHIEAERRRGKQ